LLYTQNSKTEMFCPMIYSGCLNKESVRDRERTHYVHSECLQMTEVDRRQIRRSRRVGRRNSNDVDGSVGGGRTRPRKMDLRELTIPRCPRAIKNNPKIYKTDDLRHLGMKCVVEWTIVRDYT